MDILPSDPPRILSYSLVADALASRKADLKKNNFENINSTPEGITRVINTHLGLPQDQ
jgi:hypothetical protein